MATDDNAPDEVSWQTAFFLLFGIAFLAIAQPCGQFLGVHSKHRIWLRSSPFLCLADFILIIVQFQYYSARGDGPRDAARRIVQTRFAGTTPAQQPAEQMNLTTPNPPEADITDASLDDANGNDSEEENVPLHILPSDGETLAEVETKMLLRFILGIFPLFPAIKLYTLIGIPWTQTFAAMYIASIISIEVLLWAAKPYDQVPRLSTLSDDIFTFNALIVARYFDNITDRRTRRVFRILGYLLTIFYAYFVMTFREMHAMIICFTLAAYNVLDSFIGIAQSGITITLQTFFCNWLLGLHLMLSFQYKTFHIIPILSFWLEALDSILLTACIFTVLPSYKKAQGLNTLTLGAVLVVISFIIGVTIFFLSLESYELLEESENLFSRGWVDAYVLVAATFLLLPLNLQRYNELKYGLFAAYNLFIFVLCYAYVYDPTGTIDPGWEAIWG